MPYTELHLHSAYSFLDGASMPDEIVPRALELGHQALALTDHNSLSGSMEFAQQAKALGLRAMHGAEVDLADTPGGPRAVRDRDGSGRHLTLLVRDERGWSNLCRLLTRAHADTRRPGRPGWIGEPSVSLDDVAEHAEGLVCLTGCARHGVRDEPTVRFLMDAFGPERLRVELQRPFARHDRALNRGLSAMARRLGLRCVATGDVHAHSRARAKLQDVFVAIREHTTLDASEPLRRGNHAHVLAAPEAMAARFEDHPDAVAETARLAEMLEFDLTEDLGYRYPGAEDPTADRRLAELCAVRMEDRYPPGHVHREEARTRIEEELRIIRALGLSGFFLLHHELLELAREVAVEVRGPSLARSLLPPGRGRGSSVSSIVCYLTGLSHVDPIANRLLLGRFLNEELTALPDIDLDFPRDIREVLIPRVHDRYGRERSALVAAFPTYRSRGAVREIGKALGLPPGEIERVARGVDAWGGNVVKEIGRVLGEERIKEGRWPWLAWLAAQAQGLPRHLSQHSGGMIVATRPLIDCCPVLPAAMEGRQMVQWDKDSCSDAGFLKIDLLGLGMLSAVERTVDLVAERRGETIDLSRIPFDDPETYETIQRAETTGVFQIESRAQMASLRRTRPATLDDLTVQVAIVRPGPIVGGAVNPYIKHRQRLREDPSFQVPYPHPSLEPVLRDTLGTIIFQDQVLEVAQAFARFSAGEAEGLRRAMSRRRSEAALRAYRDRFVEGAMATYDDVDEALAERVWSMVVGFSGFGFPKAHGAAFGLLAYQSTWLRVHYSPEFLCALLDEQPMGFYPPDALVHEAQRRGIEILAPDVNASAVGCTVTEEGGVRLGLGYVLGVRRDEVEALVADREASGPFATIEDLAARAGAGRGSLEQLAWSGATDGLVGERPSPSLAASSVARVLAHTTLPASLPGTAIARSSRAAAAPPTAGPPSALERSRSVARRTALWQLGVAAPGVTPRNGQGTQLALPLQLPVAPELRPLGDWDRLVADYATTGVAIEHHPMELLREELRRRGAVSCRELGALRHGAPVRVGGLVMARQRPGTANGMTFLLLEDEFGTINLVVAPPVYERHRLAVRSEPLVVAEGTLERYASAGGAINIVVRSIVALDPPDRAPAEVVELEPAAGDRGAGAEIPDAAREFPPFDSLELARRRAERAAERREAEEEEAVAAGGGARRAAAARGRGDFRAVAPPVLSFTQGRSR